MLLTAQDLARRWQITPRTVVRIPDGDLPKLNISTSGGRPTYRYRPEDVADYERARMMGGTS